MKKFLVPTDFSDTAKNAARFAVQATAHIPGAVVILYHVYDKITGGSDGSPLTVDDNDKKIVLSAALENLRDDLKTFSDVTIEFEAEEGGSLIERLRKFVRHNAVDMVIMGITGATRLEQIFMGSNSLNMVREAVCPVMIVPPNAQYKQINNVLFASDFKNVDSTTPKAQLKAVLDVFKPDLHIVNVDDEHYVELTEEFKIERNKLEKMFADYNPQFYFIRFYDFLDAISSFTADKNIDVILTVPRKHGFLTNLFKTSHTKKLAYHSHVPIVAVHE
ncbi:MAG: universal stress protein [Chitinophagaceae bacterium]|nr:MAG: universal stress protein [Chitinophagaceae bacterium]